MDRKIYVFDLDGTLVNSMPKFAQANVSILDEENIEYDRDKTVQIITPLGYRKTAEYFVSNFGVKDSVDNIVKRISDKLVYEYSNNILLKPYVKEFLVSLHQQGARLFVLTASPHLVTDVCLANNGVFDLFEKVWSVEDFSLTKSDTRLFFEVAKTIGCEPSEINYFEDNPTALANAKKAGFDTFGVYDPSNDCKIDQVKVNANTYVSSYKELILV